MEWFADLVTGTISKLYRPPWPAITHYRNVRWHFGMTFPDGWVAAGADPVSEPIPVFYGPGTAGIRLLIGPISPEPTVTDQTAALLKLAQQRRQPPLHDGHIRVRGSDHATLIVKDKRGRILKYYSLIFDGMEYRITARNSTDDVNGFDEIDSIVNTFTQMRTAITHYRNDRWHFEMTFPDGWVVVGSDPVSEPNPQFYGPAYTSIKLAIGPIQHVPTVGDQCTILWHIALRHGHQPLESRPVHVHGLDHATMVAIVPRVGTLKTYSLIFRGIEYLITANGDFNVVDTIVKTFTPI